ncbi:MAG: Ni/Fe-hydrogenase cytochrome b subunit, partial [Gammaproteobacteria bacterium]|nr:Ni/Fe-hydrogenase cytochrome b subunit [Gammaproteobacteria bacterium]
MSQHQPLNRRVITPPFLVLGVLFLIAVYYLGVRFVNGMGFVTNLNGGYAWGLWVVYDIVIGTALACGGYALAVVVYVANKGKYHP